MNQPEVKNLMYIILTCRLIEKNIAHQHSWSTSFIWTQPCDFVCHLIVRLISASILSRAPRKLQEAKSKRKGHFFVLFVNSLNPHCSGFMQNLFQVYSSWSDVCFTKTWNRFKTQKPQAFLNKHTFSGKFVSQTPLVAHPRFHRPHLRRA